MTHLITLASKLVPAEKFPLDKSLANQSIVSNLVTSLIIILFITLISWIVYEAFDRKKE